MTALAPAETRDAALSFLLDIVAARGETRHGPPAAAEDRLLAMATAWPPAPNFPVDLVGRPCPTSPPQWHLRQLLALCSAHRIDDGGDAARRLYHARWLGHLLLPDQAEFRPLVTIVIPVYNRAAMAAEAVESCLQQTWRPLEILVVDDGSTDNLARALAPFREAVRIEQQPNGGVSCARNTGIRRAQGDFIHFLDSDDLLSPEAVARKVDAFARYADAELCYSLAKISGSRATGLPRIPVPDGSPQCPTTGLLDCGKRHPFYMPCVMMPRFTLLASGGFEEDLRRGEDSRFWVKLALRDIKVVGIASKLTERRLSTRTLSAQPIGRSLHLIIAARNVADLLGNPRGWRYAMRGFADLLSMVMRDAPDQPMDMARVEISRLLAAIDALSARAGGPSPLPLLAHLRHLTRGAIQSHPELGKDSAHLLSALHGAIAAAAHRAAPLTVQDLQAWTGADIRKAHLKRLVSFAHAAAALLKESPSSLAAVDELLRNAPGIPSRRALRRYVRLRGLMLPRRIALPIALRGSR